MWPAIPSTAFCVRLSLCAIVAIGSVGNISRRVSRSSAVQGRAERRTVIYQDDVAQSRLAARPPQRRQDVERSVGMWRASRHLTTWLRSKLSRLERPQSQRHLPPRRQSSPFRPVSPEGYEGGLCHLSLVRLRRLRSPRLRQSSFAAISIRSAAQIVPTTTWRSEPSSPSLKCAFLLGEGCRQGSKAVRRRSADGRAAA